MQQSTEVWLANLNKLVPEVFKYQTVLFGLDGTLVATLSGGICANRVRENFPLPGAKQWVAETKKNFKRAALITNQGGVSCGFMTEREAWHILLEADRMFGGFDAIKVSFYYENGKFRKFYPDVSKPKADMVHAICAELGTLVEDCIMVGNAHIDKACATAAHIPFIWANDYFMWPTELCDWDDYGVFLKREVLDKCRARLLKSQ